MIYNVVLVSGVEQSDSTTPLYLQTRTYTLGLPWWAQIVKNLPANAEDRFQSPGWENPLEKGMATHFSVLVWRIPMAGGGWQAIVRGVAKKLGMS